MTFRIIESKLERTARLLAAQHNIKVSFEANKLAVTNNTITLPSIPDNASQEFVDALQGYLDQQTGYILFSDPVGINKLAETHSTDRQLFDIFKSIEDVRVQERMEDLYPGCRQNFYNMLSWFYGKLGSNFDNLTTYRKVLSLAYLQRRYSNTEIWQTADEELKDKANKVNDLIKAANPQNVKESLDVAEEVKKLFSPEEITEEQNSASSTANEQVADTIEQVFSKELPAELKHAKGLTSKVKDDHDMGYTHNLPTTGGYLIYSTAHDCIEDIDYVDLQTGGTYLSKLREDTKEVTAVMRKRLVNTLRAKQRSRWVSGRPEGKLDARKAYKAVYGISDNVYKIRTTQSKLDTAVALGIDHSGSMRGTQLELAAKAAIVLGDVLDPLGIPFLTYGFSTGNKHLAIPRQPHDYARWNNLWIGNYKRFEEPWRVGSLKLTQAHKMAKQNTLDGESVLYGIRSLLNRPESRKILFIFNDGAPFPGYGDTAKCQKYLKDIVFQAMSLGVEIVCFGIQTGEVAEYYPKWVRIDSIDDLVKQPLVELDKLLRKGLTVKKR